MTQIDAILFDKDGTLFDFQASWGNWALATLEELAGGDRALRDRLAQAIRFDPQERRFAADSTVIAGTVREVAELLAAHLPGRSLAQVTDDLDRLSQDAGQVPATDLVSCLGALRARGLRLGVATNDSEAAARVHMAGAGVLELLDFIAGYDSGHGAKPEPGPLLAFARAMDVAPGRVAMVGDSLHDMDAARAAGMRAVGVLTGPAPRAVLAPAADVVLDDISGLAGWLDAGAPDLRGAAAIMAKGFTL